MRDVLCCIGFAAAISVGGGFRLFDQGTSVSAFAP